MTPYSNQPPSIEEGVNALLTEAKEKVHQRYHHYEDCVRQSPGKAVFAALAAGYIIHRLPVRSLLVSQVRLMVALAPPTLLAFGAAKLCEFLQRQARENSVLREPPMAPTSAAVEI